MKQAGVISLFYHNWNFGGLLQAYALTAAMSETGWAAEQLSVNTASFFITGSSWKDQVRRQLVKHRVSNQLLEQHQKAKQHDMRDLHQFHSFMREIRG